MGGCRAQSPCLPTGFTNSTSFMAVLKSLICSAVIFQCLKVGARETKCHSCIPPGALSCLSIALLTLLSAQSSSSCFVVNELNQLLNSPLFTVGTIVFLGFFTFWVFIISVSCKAFDFCPSISFFKSGVFFTLCVFSISWTIPAKAG